MLAMLLKRACSMLSHCSISMMGLLAEHQPAMANACIANALVFILRQEPEAVKTCSWS